MKTKGHQIIKPGCRVKGVGCSKTLAIVVACVFAIAYCLLPTACLYAVPTAIVNLTATQGSGDGEVDLKWTTPTGAEKYLLKYHTSILTKANVTFTGTEYTQSWSTGPAGLDDTQTLTGLEQYSGQTLYFSLQGWTEDPYEFGEWNSYQDLAGTNTLAYCQVGLVVPSAIDDIAVTAGFQQAILVWTAPGDDGDSYDITGGTIEIRCSMAGPIITETDWSNTSTGYPYRIVIPTSTTAGSTQRFVVTGLTNGTLYYFAIKTRDDNTLGWSGLDTTSPEPSCTPFNVPPTAFDITVPANCSITTDTTPSFEWGESSDPDGQGAVTYGLQISLVSDFVSLIQAPVNIDTTTYTLIEALADDNTYYWRVKAIDAGGAITYSNNTRILYVNTSNSSPIGFDLVSPNNDIVLKKPKLSWDESSDPDPPGTIRYEVQYSTYSDLSAYSAVSGLTAVSYTFTSNLTESTTYYWRVAAYDEYTTPAVTYSSSTFLFYVQPVLPAAPANVRIIDNMIYWDAVSRDEDGAGISDFSSYKIYRSADVKILGTEATSAGYTTETSTPAVSGYWTVIRAVDIFGNESKNSAAVNPTATEQFFISNDRDLIIEVPQTAQSSISDKIISIPKSGNIYQIKPLNSSDLSEVSNFEFSAPVKITFETTDDCVYWHNGIEYVALGGKIGNSITIETTKLGTFYTGKLTDTDFKLASSFPTKIFTPNSDGINDEINLTFTGNKEAITDAEIFDITGRRIGTMTQKDYTWFIWDGKDDDGRTVLPGIYIYQVRCGDEVCNGTVVVAR